MRLDAGPRGLGPAGRRSERSVRQQPEELRRLQSRHQRLSHQDPGGPEEPHARRHPGAEPEAHRALPDQQPQVQDPARARHLDRLDVYRRT